MDLGTAADSGICFCCGQVRPLEALLAYWPRYEPERRRYVCRPSMPQAPFFSCFRDVVETIEEHVISLATGLARSMA